MVRDPILWSELLDRHAILVDRIVAGLEAKMPVGIHEPKDLIHEGIIALMLAAARYQPRRGTFEDYATIVIRGHVLRYIINGSSVNAGDITHWDHVSPLHDMRDALMDLDDCAREVVVRSFGLDGKVESDDAIASRLNINKKDVRIIRMEALSMMRTDMEER
jgi:DNA-directed RNA polymerase sigma subunit (sigma70/sigma32)